MTVSRDWELGVGLLRDESEEIGMVDSPRCRSCGTRLDTEAGDEVVELRTTGVAGPEISGGPLCKSCYADVLANPHFSVVRTFKVGPKRVVYVPDPSYFSSEQCRYAREAPQQTEE